MSLLVLMYHRARAGRHGNAPAMLDAHFAHISRTYPNVMPGDPLVSGKINVCLSFDDGYYDFYATVFPLLRKYHLRALLAVPPLIVSGETAIPSESRLGIDTEEAFANPACGGFCTWSELSVMATSGHVTIAAHGFTHTRLDLPHANLGTEIGMAQTLLEAKLKQGIESFVFPFGRCSPRALRNAHKSYRYVFRIGGALNHSWERALLYRVDADEMKSPSAVFSRSRLVGYHLRYFWNRLRGR